MLTAAILVIFPFAMVFAAMSDLVSMTISNRVPLALLVAFVGLALLCGLPLPTIGAHLAVGLGCLALTFGFFAAGWMGGGDAKLIAATALWFGPGVILFHYVLLASVYGGVLTLVLLMARGRLQPATGIDFVDRLLQRETGVPYGIALGAAGLTVYSTSFWMDLAIGGIR